MAIGATPRATRREWIGLIVLALPCLLLSMDLAVLDLALPALPRRSTRRAHSCSGSWTSTASLLAGSLITMGALGDRIGRRRLLMFGAGAFGAASVFAAFANSAEMPIVARAVLGVASGHTRPVDAFVLAQNVQRPERADDGDRDLERGLRRRRRNRPARRRRPRRAVLVGR